MFATTPLHPIRNADGTDNAPRGGVPDEAKKKVWSLNPFKIREKKETKIGKHSHYQVTWERKELPGAGAGQYSYETYGQPITPTYGRGNINVTNPLRETSPGHYVYQSVGIVGSPPQGVLQGQFITQPLLDPNAAAAYGIVANNVIPSGPNAIVNGAPVLGP